ncbi:MAG: PadR family transcriptional regulator [Solirubrobacterales bacterium]
MKPRASEPGRFQPPQSTVQWALLGLVIERPSYGYELATRLERAYGGEVRLSSTSYAYTALEALKDRGLVEIVPGRGSDRQPKPTYRATPAGIAALQEQLVSEVGEERRRSRVSARKLAVFAREPEVALALIDRMREACLKEAVRVSSRPLAGADGLDTTSPLGARLATEEGRLALDAKLAWLDYAARELKAISERRPPGR